MLRVPVGGENLHEQRQKPGVVLNYPRGMHTTIAEGIKQLLGELALVHTATFDQPEHGLTEDVLTTTDVLTWWGHVGHALVDTPLLIACTSECCWVWASSSFTPAITRGFHALDGHHVLAAVAGGRRVRAGLERRATPSDHPRITGSLRRPLLQRAHKSWI
jgi:hypothetical protein